MSASSASETSTPGPGLNGKGTGSNLRQTTPGLNLQHLELLHHFCTVTYTTFSPEPSQTKVWQTIVVRMALSFPFLMHELLAIGALHLGHCRRESQNYYFTQATELQSQALVAFNTSQKEVDASSCGAIFVFSCLLSLHVLADPLRTSGLDATQYLDHVLNCLKLMGSVRRLVIKDWWDYLRDTELKPLFPVQLPGEPYDGIPDECKELANLTRESNLGDQAHKVCDKATERIQWIYAVSEIPPRPHFTVHWLLAWPIQLQGEYLDSLGQRQPEALVILAYFAVVMHYFRASWVVGDSGSLLIRALDAHLGPRWAKWMAWPVRMISTEVEE